MTQQERKREEKKENKMTGEENIEETRGKQRSGHERKERKLN